MVSSALSVQELLAHEAMSSRRLPAASGAETVVLVSPALAGANNGNWHTAERWSQFLSGHCVVALMACWPQSSSALLQRGSKPPALMIALHARRSAASIVAWAEAHPHRPLIVVLTGTDLYRDIASDADAQRSLELASHLVVLQSAGINMLPPAVRCKARVIYQSAAALQPGIKSKAVFTVVMVGHLRDEKDPLTFMQAAAQAQAGKTQWLQIGAALDSALGEAARSLEESVPGYRWLGELPRPATRQRIKRAHLLVNCSKMEGGAHVILEAVQSGTPVLASSIDGNIGMLGADYAGYFEAGHAGQLAALVQRCQVEPEFLQLLAAQCAARAPLFEPAEEKRHVLNLVSSALANPHDMACLDMKDAR